MKLDTDMLVAYGDSNMLCQYICSHYGINIPIKLAENFYSHEEAYILIHQKEKIICIPRVTSDRHYSFSLSEGAATFAAAVILVKSNRAKAFLIKE